MLLKQKPKIIVVLGPTATGKSDLGVYLAKKFNGEIISADSRQVYKGLDIGSGKVTKKEMAGIPHHLLDVVSPTKTFSVSDYAKLANKYISQILKKNKTPILVGGTGFYIDSVAKGLILPEVEANPILRKKLAKLALEKLQEKLKELDPKRYKEIDKNNPTRLIRSIEIAIKIGKMPKVRIKPQFEVLYVGLDLPDEILKEKIEKRLLARIKKGMIAEGKNLRKKGLSLARMKSLGLEYRYMAYNLQGLMTKDEMIQELLWKIWQYAKRQKTWFKKNENIHWFLPGENKKVEKLVKEFLKKD